MAEDLKIFFSLVSGDVYEIFEDEVKNLDDTQVPLLKKPNQKCNICYGRFYESRHGHFEKSEGAKGDWVLDYYTPCPKCATKCIDWKNMKAQIDVAMPKTVGAQVADDSFVEAIENKEIPVTVTEDTTSE